MGAGYGERIDRKSPVMPTVVPVSNIRVHVILKSCAFQNE